MTEPGLRIGGVALISAGVAALGAQLLLFGATSGWWPATTVASAVYAVLCGALCLGVCARPTGRRLELIPGLQLASYGCVVCVALLVAAMVLGPAGAVLRLAVPTVGIAVVGAVFVRLAIFRIEAGPRRRSAR